MEVPQDFESGRIEAGLSDLYDKGNFPLVPHLDLDHCRSLTRDRGDGNVQVAADRPTMHYTLRSCEADSLEGAIRNMLDPASDDYSTIHPAIDTFRDRPGKKFVIGILLPSNGRALADSLESVLNELDFSSDLRRRMDLEGVLICVVADSVDSESGGTRLEPRHDLRKELAELGLWSDAIVEQNAGFASRAKPRSRRRSQSLSMSSQSVNQLSSRPSLPPSHRQPRQQSRQQSFESSQAGAGNSPLSQSSSDASSTPAAARSGTFSPKSATQLRGLAAKPDAGVVSHSNISRGTLRLMHRRARHQRVLLRDRAAETHDSRHLLWFAHRPNCYTRLRGRREFHLPIDICCIVERHPLDLHSASFWVRNFMAEQVQAENVLLLQGGTTLLFQSLAAMLSAASYPGVGTVTPATQVRVPNACDGFNPAFAAAIFHHRISDLLYRIPSSVFGYCPTLSERCYLLNRKHLVEAGGSCLDHPPERNMGKCNPLRPLTFLRGFSAVSGTRCMANAIALRCGLRVVHVPAARCSVPGPTTVTAVGLRGKVRAGAVVWGVADALLSLRSLWGSRRNVLAKLAVTGQVLAACVELPVLAVAPALAYVGVRACVGHSLALSPVASQRWIGEMIKFAFVVLLIAQVSLAMRTSPSAVPSLHMLAFAFLGFMATSTFLYFVAFSALRVDELAVRAAAGTLALLQLDTMLHEHVTTLIATAPQAIFMSFGALIGGIAHSVFAGGVDEPPCTTRAHIPSSDMDPAERAMERGDGADPEAAPSPGSSSFARASGSLSRRSNDLAVMWFALNIAVVTVLSSSVISPANTIRLLMGLTAVLLLPRLAITFLSGLVLRVYRCRT